MSKITLIEQNLDPATPAAGRVTIFARNGRTWLINDVGNATEIGESQEISIRKASSGTIPVGTPVYATGYDDVNGVVLVEAARANAAATMSAFGICTNVATDLASGHAAANGQLGAFDTSAWAVGDRLYVSASVAGEMVNTPPVGPNLNQSVARVVKSAASGIIIIEISDRVPLSDVASQSLGSASAGTSADISRADHVHAHGNLAGGSLHAEAVAGVSAGFISAADQSKLDGIASNATNTPLADSAPPAVGTASVGVSTDAAREDHSHALPATADMNARLAVKKAGSVVGTRRAINLIEGSNVTLTVTDDAANEEVDVTVAAAFPVFTWEADNFLNPTNSDWPISALAPLDLDNAHPSIPVRRFDDTTEEAVAFQLRIPSGATNMIIRIISKGRAAPGAAATVGSKFYYRQIPDNVAVAGSWSSKVLNDIDIPTNTNVQHDEQTLVLASAFSPALDTPGLYQCMLSRPAPAGGTDLTGDWHLVAVQITFT